MDKDGRQTLAGMVTQKDGVTSPLYVYYSKHRDSIIVGMMRDNDISVFKAQ
ncbi:hypothetical protein DPMN_036841 [Dreissena polymorpha]|uniref:Uncharacterized protein n=1 Tax=Dreissena polymorpha TaxID=45954 RepID=A0A9D4MBJ7_DREPO|nr:hypothetical protein DPMN_036841 [Dreissena polymorpha]